eukprot:NODE_294_length_10530_cov_0.245326.p7 type:complete len:113 gc:universal NODE_294_length_10530_cov_0.245326:6078-6416(+)
MCPKNSWRTFYKHILITLRNSIVQIPHGNEKANMQINCKKNWRTTALTTHHLTEPDSQANSSLKSLYLIVLNFVKHFEFLLKDLVLKQPKRRFQIGMQPGMFLLENMSSNQH